MESKVTKEELSQFVKDISGKPDNSFQLPSREEWKLLCFEGGTVGNTTGGPKFWTWLYKRCSEEFSDWEGKDMATDFPDGIYDILEEPQISSDGIEAQIKRGSEPFSGQVTMEDISKQYRKDIEGKSADQAVIIPRIFFDKNGNSPNRTVGADLIRKKK